MIVAMCGIQQNQYFGQAVTVALDDGRLLQCSCNEGVWGPWVTLPKIPPPLPTPIAIGCQVILDETHEACGLPVVARVAWDSEDKEIFVCFVHAKAAEPVLPPPAPPPPPGPPEPPTPIPTP